METMYRGFEIVQPTIFKRNLHTIGNGTTSIKVRGHKIGEEKPATLKTINFPRNNSKELEQALQKAKTFIDDLLLVGTTVEIKAGEHKGLVCSIDETNRRSVEKKSVLFVTVNLPGDDRPPFATFKEDELIFL